MSTASPEIDEIRKRMASIRREMHENVKGVVQNAEEVTDWRRYVRSSPLLALGGAFVVGYLIVPRKQAAVLAPQVIATPQGVTGPGPQQFFAAAEPAAKKSSIARTLFGAAFGLVSPIAIRAAQGYAMQYLESFIAQQAGGASALQAFLANAGAAQPPEPAPARPKPDPTRPGTPRPGDGPVRP
ncbi:hypothetical protein EP7_002116 [Isosphaeraceae bacterium EP7]